MQRKQLIYSALTLAALSLPVAVGCGKQSSPAPATAQAETDLRAAQPPASSATTVVNEGAETAPAQTVAIFLDSLRKGDERAANGVLTALAREELAKSTWQIQPLGTPAGQYKIGRVGFPYPEKTVALVECTWTEPPVEGNAQEIMDIVCEVHQEAEGWRISGMGVTIPGTDQALVLDFEDAASLKATIEAATGQTSPGAQPAGSQPTGSQPAGTQIATGQVSAGQVSTGQAATAAGLPAFPAGNDLPGSSGTATPALPSYPQIALPPLNNAPINR